MVFNIHLSKWLNIWEVSQWLCRDADAKKSNWKIVFGEITEKTWLNWVEADGYSGQESLRVSLQNHGENEGERLCFKQLPSNPLETLAVSCTNSFFQRQILESTDEQFGKVQKKMNRKWFSVSGSHRDNTNKRKILFLLLDTHSGVSILPNIYFI